MNSSSSQHSLAPAPSWAVTLVRAWHRVECGLAVVAFSLIAVLVIYDVLARELGLPLLRALGMGQVSPVIPGAAKMGVYALIVGAFCGVGIATATGVQLVPKVAFGWVPASWGPRMNRIADLVSAVFLTGVAWYGWVFVMGSKATGLLTSGGVDVPAWTIQAVIPLGFLSAAGRYLMFAAWPALRPVPPEFQE